MPRLYPPPHLKLRHDAKALQFGDYRYNGDMVFSVSTIQLLFVGRG